MGFVKLSKSNSIPFLKRVTKKIKRAEQCAFCIEGKNLYKENLKKSCTNIYDNLLSLRQFQNSSEMHFSEMSKCEGFLRCTDKNEKPYTSPLLTTISGHRHFIFSPLAEKTFDFFQYLNLTKRSSCPGVFLKQPYWNFRKSAKIFVQERNVLQSVQLFQKRFSTQRFSRRFLEKISEIFGTFFFRSMT